MAEVLTKMLLFPLPFRVSISEQGWSRVSLLLWRWVGVACFRNMVGFFRANSGRETVGGAIFVSVLAPLSRDKCCCCCCSSRSELPFTRMTELSTSSSFTNTRGGGVFFFAPPDDTWSGLMLMWADLGVWRLLTGSWGAEESKGEELAIPWAAAAFRREVGRMVGVWPLVAGWRRAVVPLMLMSVGWACRMAAVCPLRMVGNLPFVRLVLCV